VVVDSESALGSAQQVSLSFPHGLGDCVNFARALPLYARRGYDITVACNSDKKIVFADSGVDVVHDSDRGHYPVYSWDEPPGPASLSGRNFGTFNKGAANRFREFR
jgi:hypothetical protein